MALQKTQWKPDTCNCVVQYTWDDTEPQRVHTLHSVIIQGDEHAGLTHQEVYDTVTEENPRKNITLEEIKKALPALTETVKQPDGTNLVVFKKDSQGEDLVKWTFDAQRNLEITIPTATSKDKTDVVAALTTKDSDLAGKVVIK